MVFLKSIKNGVYLLRSKKYSKVLNLSVSILNLHFKRAIFFCRKKNKKSHLLGFVKVFGFS